MDGLQHAISLYDSTSAQISVNEPKEPVTWDRETMGPLLALRAGSQAQTLLRPAGDDTRINWGYVYAVAPNADATGAIGGGTELANRLRRERQRVRRAARRQGDVRHSGRQGAAADRGGGLPVERDEAQRRQGRDEQGKIGALDIAQGSVETPCSLRAGDDIPQPDAAVGEHGEAGSIVERGKVDA